MLKTDISELDAPVVQRMAPFGLLLLLITAGGGWLLKKSVASRSNACRRLSSKSGNCSEFGCMFFRLRR